MNKYPQLLLSHEQCNSLLTSACVAVSGVLANHRTLSSSDFEFNENPLDQLPADIRSLIERVVICQDQYEMPSEEDVNRVLSLAVSSLGHHT